jgi:probable HAF family extracellular repeat protein
MSHCHTRIAYQLYALCLLHAAPQAIAADFVPLGVPMPIGIGIPVSAATDVSNDGAVVLGHDGFALGHGYGIGVAYRWTRDSGKVLFDHSSISSANGLSSDGSVVVGAFNLSGNTTAYRWTSNSGVIGLGYLSGDTNSGATGVSANGAVVVGSSMSTGAVESMSEAFRWTSADGMIGLGDLPGGRTGSHATGVSSDGSVVVGWSFSADGIVAFRWTSDSGMVWLGDLPGADFESHPAGVSSDGSVIVGWGRSHPQAPEAFRWTSETGMIGLGYLAGGESWSIANDVSADGAVIVGSSSSVIGNEAFLWDATNGMRSLSELLTDLGVDLSGWTLSTANAISADGKTIVGSGINPSGQQEAWAANISAVPEPGNLVLLVSALSTFAKRRWTKAFVS